MIRAGVHTHNYFTEPKKIEKELLPCPFCSNTEIEFALIHPQYNGKPDMDYWCYWHILCPECGALMENGRMETQTWEDAAEEIVNSWNTRIGGHS